VLSISAMTQLDPNWLNTLFMDASIALFMVAIALATLTLIAIVWGRNWVSAEISKHTERQTEIAAIRMGGFIGFLCGQLRKVNPDFLDQAIELSRDAYKNLPDGDGGKIGALNNLAFYLSVRGNRADGDESVKLARLLRQYYGEMGNVEHLNTYAAIVATYHDVFPDPHREIDEALLVLDTVLRNIRIPERSKQNARKHKRKLKAIKRPKKVATRPKRVAYKTKKRAGS